MYYKYPYIYMLIYVGKPEGLSALFHDDKFLCEK